MALARIVTVSVATTVVLLLAARTRSQELPRATPAQGAFAFPDPTGRRLLVVADVAQPEGLHEAICNNGRRVPVRFEKRQVEQPNDSQATRHRMASKRIVVPLGLINRENEGE